MTARRIAPLLALVLALSFTAITKAADEKTFTGTWKWTVTRNGQDRTTTLKLKQDGDKVTGSVAGNGANATDTEITNVTLKDGTLAFEVTRERGGNKFTMKYSGKLDGDSIKGSYERPGQNGGDPVKTDWEAKREKEEAK